jgi:hypothetical protein
MQNLHRYFTGAVLGIVLLFAGCINLPGPGDTASATIVPAGAAAPAHTPTPIPASPTPEPSPTTVPTETPVPTITPTPTETSIPGWSELRGNEVKLWLPDTWRGGNPDSDLDQLLADANSAASEIKQFAAVLEENREAVNLWAYDTQSTGNFHLTNVNIGQEKVDETVTVDLYIEAINRNLPENFSVTGQQLIDTTSLSGSKIFIDVAASGLVIKEVMYIFKVEDTMWLVTFAAISDIFEKQLEIIELSIQTLEIEGTNTEGTSP